eukprot:Platyproteum_vivax@DN939_c0_g1_i2.p1
MKCRIGVLAIQGAFLEHQVAFEKLNIEGLEAVQVRTEKELNECDGLVLPGGESTTMRIVANTDSFMRSLSSFVSEKPVWGTCAGCILLANQITSGSPLSKDSRPSEDSYGNFIGGMDIQVSRNYFGRQIDSFEVELSDTKDAMFDLMPAVCIRAPAITNTLSDDVEVLAHLKHPNLDEPVIAIARQNNKLASIFHPELTDDLRIHSYFYNKLVVPNLKNN